MGYQNLKFPDNSVFLITGGAGFIGSNLCDAVIGLGYRVRCLDNLSNGFKKNIEHLMDHPHFEFIEADIRDIDACHKACQNVDYVLHQAAWGSVPRSIEMPVLYEEINIRGTLNMMEAAKSAGVKKFVYASSSSVYGDSPILPKKEGTEGNLLSPYALTKRVNEDYARLYKILYGLDTYGLRYFNVFGRRQNPKGDYAAVIPKFIDLIKQQKQPVIYGDGLQSRDFTYIENVIEANLKACLASSESAGQAFNIGYNDQITLLNVYETICRSMGHNAAPTFAEPRKGDIKHSHADISKAKDTFGYEPDWSFEDGLKAAIDWYSQEGSL